ncbi:MAG: gluconokinase, partial [Ramlibacter sp.]
QAIAAQLHLPLVEGDAFHPESNIEKMRRGLPLDDNDRAGWLAGLGRELRSHPQGAVLTCSALKATYRDVLRASVAGLHFVHLALPQEHALARVAARAGHFYPPSLVASQFSALQDPTGEPGVVVVDATLSLEQVVAGALDGLEKFNNA